MSAPAWDLPFLAIRHFYRVFRAPKLKLRNPLTVETPTAGAILWIILFAYFLTTSGVIYDVLMQPPSVGVIADPITGRPKPAAVMPGRLNSQYIIEGLMLGFFFMLAACGLLLVRRGATTSNLGSKWFYGYSFAGCAALLGSLKMCEECLSIKLPTYLRGYVA